MNYTKQQILEVVNNQLLHWIKKDEAVKNAVFELVQTKYPTRKEMDDKFDRLLNELACDRVSQEKKWEAQEKKWDEQKAEDKKAWDDWFIRYEADRAEDKRKWDEHRAEDKKKYEADRAEDKKKYEADRAEDKKKWDEQNRKWDEKFDKNLAEIKLMNSKISQHLSSIGDRWGTHAEASFRNALKGILKGLHSEYDVIHYDGFDSEGIVYGKPSSVEIDVIVKNGNVFLIEISMRIYKSDISCFRNKITFFEKKHKQKVNQLLIISPAIDEHARTFAQEEGFKLYTYAEDVNL